MESRLNAKDVLWKQQFLIFLPALRLLAEVSPAFFPRLSQAFLA